jgi:ribosomal protein S18 acetylase RimI-like enzyme
MVMLMSIHLRRARATDMPQVKKLAAETAWKDIPETQRKLLNRKKWNKHMVEVLENILKRENIETFIAEDERHRRVGHVLVGQNSNPMIGLTIGFIYDIYVEEKFRGKGIGKLLMDKAEGYCRKRGYSRIALGVSTANDSAVRLYNRTGFKPERMTMAKEII